MYAYHDRLKNELRNRGEIKRDIDNILKKKQFLEKKLKMER